MGKANTGGFVIFVWYYMKQFFFFFLVEVQCSDIWSGLGEFKDPRLARLAERVKTTVMKSRADSTVRKYVGAFRRWCKWASDKEEITAFPVKAQQFVLYLEDIGSRSDSSAAVEEAVNSISWVQQIAGCEAISESQMVKVVVAGLKRILAKPKVKKEPITPQMLRQMMESTSSPRTLTESRLMAICLLAFAGFLRVSEVMGLRCCEVKFRKDHMSILIASSKTDQYRDGAEVVIARIESSICPVRQLEEYFKLAELSPESTQKLFRGIVKSAGGEKLRQGGSLSYTRIREMLLGKLQELGHNPALYGTHSFRAGGATLAANSGVEDRMFKRHGRWASESAKDGYIKDSLETRLQVSKSLEL